eukprot:gene12243-56875_t
MRRRRVRPDADTFVHVLTALQRSIEEPHSMRHLVWVSQKALRLYDDMNKFRVAPTVRTHALLLKLLPPGDEQLSRHIFNDP